MNSKFIIKISGAKEKCRKAYVMLSQLSGVLKTEMISEANLPDNCLVTVQGNCLWSAGCCFMNPCQKVTMKTISEMLQVEIALYACTLSGDAEMYRYRKGVCVKADRRPYNEEQWNAEDFILLNAIIKRYSLAPGTKRAA